MLLRDFTTLYLDLNSCFASVAQQLDPALRGRPVAVVNRDVENATIIAASYQAKRRGVKVGLRRRDAALLCPELRFVESTPAEYTRVHRAVKAILGGYSPVVVMKSIDEGYIDLTVAPILLRERPALEVAQEIKDRIRAEVGECLTSNIGLAGSHWLAKLAAELHKPDGLDYITPENQRAVFAQLKLTDLPGINRRLAHRLMSYGLRTPLDLLDASEDALRTIFKSVDGTKWYHRLHGFEVDDDAPSAPKSIGRQYVLGPNPLTRVELEARFAHLVEEVGFRLRRQGFHARGVLVWALAKNGQRHQLHRLLDTTFSSDTDIWIVAGPLFDQLPDSYASSVSLSTSFNPLLPPRFRCSTIRPARKRLIVWPPPSTPSTLVSVLVPFTPPSLSAPMTSKPRFRSVPSATSTPWTLSPHHLANLWYNGDMEMFAVILGGINLVLLAVLLLRKPQPPAENREQTERLIRIESELDKLAPKINTEFSQ